MEDNYTFMAEIYETTTEGDFKGNPIFYCRGTRFEDWTRTLAFIDFLSRERGTIRSTVMERNTELLERWFCQVQYRARQVPFLYKLHLQIRNKGAWADIRLPESWLSLSVTENGKKIPKMVLKDMERETQNTILTQPLEQQLL